MKKLLLLFIFLSTMFGLMGSSISYAQVVIAPVVPPTQVVTTAPVVSQSDALPPDGSWITDPEVTTIGKNAVRAGDLLDWTLSDYKWASSSNDTTNPLVPFWLIIQRIVYALFLFVILVTAFILIVTRGRSLSAKRFLPRFFMVILLVTFSFSLVQFLYQITDIFQGFFLKNPSGSIISSHDLLYIGFDYKTFQGLRVFGQSYDESAFTSLLLIKLTSFTYYVMAILLIFRKIILWFLIIISPVFPLLLLFYPLRNTAKIWVGEFFRWLLYAPLFAVFLAGLVRLWQSGLPLFFNYTGVGKASSAIYPTAINILLGGPGQTIGLNNSLNLPNTFALYLVALLMLWAVIILPFILLQIFLDYMMAFNYQSNPFMKQIFTMLNTRPTTPLGPSPTPPPATTGLARRLPFTKKFEMPRTTGLARQIPTGATQSIERPSLVTRNNQTEITRLTNLSIPTMRDIARFETTKLSHDTLSQREIERTQQTLVQIASPASTSSTTERERLTQIRERLVTEGQKGNQVATNILNAATTYSSLTTQTNQSSLVQQTSQIIQNLSHPTTIISKRDQQKFVQIKDELTKAASGGNQFAQTVLTSVNSYTTNQVTQLKQILEQIAHPEKITDTTQKEKFTSLREKIVTASKSGNPLATLLSTSLETATSQEQVTKIQEQLLDAKAQGNPLATDVLKTLSSEDNTSEKDVEKLHETLVSASKQGDPLATLLLGTLTSQKAQTAPVSATAKLKAGSFPQVNRIQQVSLDDYEAVKKMWKDNYTNLDVPDSITGQQTRKEWVTQDIASIEETISLLSSTNPQDVEKGMQQVSDILPFLLIGGFSQTEIIAYLKAKLEAGKSVVEETSEQQEEEDTLLSAEHAAKAATGHMSASIEVPTPIDSTPSLSETDSDTLPLTELKQVSSTPSLQPMKVVTDNKLLELTHLSLPRLTDIASFETAKDKSGAMEIQTVLTKIAHPEQLTSDDKDRFVKIKEELLTESKNNNPLAEMILAATGQVDSLSDELSQKDSLEFAQAISQVINPETVKAQAEHASLKKENDPFALSLEKESGLIEEQQSEKTKDFVQKLSNPTSLMTASEQMHYNKLVERIAQASEDGNPTASLLLRTAREPLSKESVAKLLLTLITQTRRGDTLAAYISESIYALTPDQEKAMASLYKQAKKEKAKGNSLARALLTSFTLQRQDNTQLTKEVKLPKQNGLQQVALDDYETVKKLWVENYQTTEVPSGMSREDWLRKESTTITDTINLLSSQDGEKVQQGLQQVADILPFLLLGGFSQDEIIGYLKAKLEAGKTVLKNSQDSAASDKLLKVKNSSVAQNKQAMQALSSVTPSQNQEATISDADIFLLTLRSVLDPSLVEDIPSQQNYRTARELLIEARQKGDEQALRLMKLIDLVSQREIEAVSSLLHFLDSPQQIVDDTKRRTYETLISQLENAQTINPLASALLKALHDEITPVSANKLRVMLVEGQAKHEPLATQIMLTMLTLSDNVRSELKSATETMLKRKNSDTFSLLFMRLFAEQKDKQTQALRTNH